MKTLTSILKEIESVEFNGSTYYPIREVERLLSSGGMKVVFNKKDATPLPFGDKLQRAMTEAQIKALLEAKGLFKQEDLSDFNKKLTQALNFDPKK